MLHNKKHNSSHVLSFGSSDFSQSVLTLKTLLLKLTYDKRRRTSKQEVILWGNLSVLNIMLIFDVFTGLHLGAEISMAV